MAFTWFPGHMRKALRRIEADARLVDLVLLLLDARAPVTSRNATLEKTLLGRGKRLLFVLSKADMADAALTQAWVRDLQRDGQDAVAVSGATGAGRAGLLQVLQARHKVSLDAARRRGIQHPLVGSRRFCIRRVDANVVFGAVHVVRVLHRPHASKVIDARYLEASLDIAGGWWRGAGSSSPRLNARLE